MTEKRFSIAIDSNNLKSLWDNERTEEEPLLYLTRSDRIGGIDNVCELLNELNDENKELEIEIEQLKSKNKILLEHCDDLQERNDRQADTIRELYNLIENKDWETLTGMINDFKECEEQLQREWKCYE